MLKIITDSACDIASEECQRLGLEVVPLSLNFNGEIYRDGIDLSKRQFFAMLAQAEKLPTTSQVNPAQFEEAFRAGLESGNELLVVTISSHLSATMQSAHIATAALNTDKIHIVDSLSASLGEELLLREALRLYALYGCDAAELAAKLKELIPKMRVFAVVDTLKYLKMGGRLSGGAALVGEVLGILPVVQVTDGRIEAIGKVRGEKNAMKKFAALFGQYEIDYERGVVFSHADAPERLESFIAALPPLPEDAPVYRSGIGSVIGAHIGPGVVAAAFFEK